MWVLKLKLESKGQFLGRMAVKHGVSLSGYPLSCSRGSRWLDVLVCGVMFGPEEAKKALVKDISNQPECSHLEVKDDFVIMNTRQPLFAAPVYDPLIFRPVPIIINSRERKHTWTLASFDRSRLEQVFAFAKKKYSAQIVFFRQQKLPTVSIMSFLPSLTKKQKLVMEAAINAGYYDYPRNAKLKGLAKAMGISYSTFQAHLRKAEGRLIPSVFRDL